MCLSRALSVSFATGLFVLSGSHLAHVLAQTRTPSGQRRHYAGDLAATKYSPLDQITRGNVNDLEVANDEIPPRFVAFSLP